MLRLQPLALIADGADKYRVRFKRADREVDYIFTMGGSLGRGISDYDDAFFFDTHDDPEAEWLQRCILSFDESRQEGIRIPEQDGILDPQQILFEGEDSAGRQKYRLVLVDNGNSADYLVTIETIDGERVATWLFGSISLSTKLSSSVPSKCDTQANILLQSILKFNEARSIAKET